MKLELEGKVALVTASSGGIGLEIARSLAGENATVIINGRSQGAVDSAIENIKRTHPGAQLLPLATDNSTAEGNEETIKQFPHVDILVNNLGIYEPVGFFEETDEAWQKLFDVNIMGGVRLARHYLKKMLEKNSGRVIFISSESAYNPAPEMAHYSATKTMQLSISRSLAELTKGTDVTVNTVLPGPTRTENLEKFVKSFYPSLPSLEAEKKFMQENRPTSLLGKLIDPKQVADVVTFVCSPLAAAMNGGAIRAEGGLLRHL